MPAPTNLPTTKQMTEIAKTSGEFCDRFFPSDPYSWEYLFTKSSMSDFARHGPNGSANARGDCEAA